MIRPMRPIAAIGFLTALSACSTSNTPTAQQQYQAQLAQNQWGVDPSRLSKSGSKQVAQIGGNNGINPLPSPADAANNISGGSFCFPPFMTCDGGGESSGGYAGGYERQSERSRRIEVDREDRQDRDDDKDDSSDKKEKKNKPVAVAEEALTIVINKDNAMNIFSRLNLRDDLKLSIKNQTSYPDSRSDGWKELADKSAGTRINEQFDALRDAGAFDITRRWGINQICVREPDPTKILKLSNEGPKEGKQDKNGNVIPLAMKDVCSYTCFTSFSRPGATPLKVTPELTRDANVVVGSKAEEVAQQIDDYMALMESQITSGPMAATTYTFDDQKKPVYANVNSKAGNGSVTSNANLTTQQATFEKKAEKFKDLTQDQNAYFKTHDKDRALYELLVLAGATDKLGNWDRIETDQNAKDKVRDLSVRSSNDMIVCKWTIPVQEAEKILRAVKPEYGEYVKAQEEVKNLKGIEFRKAAKLHAVPKADATLSGSDREQFFLNAFIAGDATCFFQMDPNSKVIPITGTPSLATK